MRVPWPTNRWGHNLPEPIFFRKRHPNEKRGEQQAEESNLQDTEKSAVKKINAAARKQSLNSTSTGGSLHYEVRSEEVEPYATLSQTHIMNYLSLVGFVWKSSNEDLLKQRM